jgi:hypothetical protein
VTGGAQRRTRNNAERNHCGGVAVYDGADVRTCLIDRGVNESLEKGLACAPSQGSPERSSVMMSSALTSAGAMLRAIKNRSERSG